MRHHSDSPSGPRTATRRAIAYIHKSQREDGSWFGSWGICFTYASMFALECLSLNGETYDSSESARKACEFLRSKQKLDGGWGETYMVPTFLIAYTFVSFIWWDPQSCVTGIYTEHSESQVVQTAWALLGLIHGKYPRRQPLECAVRLIMSRQLPVSLPSSDTPKPSLTFTRMDHGLRSPLRASSTKPVPSLIQTLSLVLQSGLSAKHTNILSN